MSSISAMVSSDKNNFEVNYCAECHKAMPFCSNREVHVLQPNLALISDKAKEAVASLNYDVNQQLRFLKEVQKWIQKDPKDKQGKPANLSMRVMYLVKVREEKDKAIAIPAHRAIDAPSIVAIASSPPSLLAVGPSSEAASPSSAVQVLERT